MYNPLNRFYKSQTGGVVANKNVTFRVKGAFDSVVFVFKKDGDDFVSRMNMVKENDCFSIDVSFPRGLYFYCFEACDKFIGLGDDYKGQISQNAVWFQLTAYDEDFLVPDWLKGGVIYQIFPDRFCRGGNEKNISPDKILHENWLETPVYNPNHRGIVVNNDFFGGDIKGIISKLDYLKELNVSCIYLNPIFKAFSNHRYDTGNYMEIDPLLGTKEDFIELILKAKELNIKIVLDGVFNHTGDDSIYFNKYGKYNSIGAYQSKDSPYYNWFNFVEFPDNYESWWGVKTLPSVNENCQSFIDYITGPDGVLEYYTKLGVGGWRLDVVDELPTQFVRKIREAVKRINNNATVIGEVWEDASNKISYGVRREYFQGKELDSVMNYPLKNAIINYVRNGDSNSLSFTVKEQIDHYPKLVLDNLMNILSTHDTARLLTVLGGVDMTGKSKGEMANTFIPEENLALAKQKLKIATLLQFTLPGVPSIYYGDEAGMQGYIDPLNRRCFPWGQEDKEILNWYKFLGKVRNTQSAFVSGEFVEIYSADGTFIFKRFDEKSEVLIAVNVGNKEQILSFNGELFDLYSNKEFKDKFILKGQSFAVLINCKK